MKKKSPFVSKFRGWSKLRPSAELPIPRPYACHDTDRQWTRSDHPAGVVIRREAVRSRSTGLVEWRFAAYSPEGGSFKRIAKGDCLSDTIDAVAAIEAPEPEATVEISDDRLESLARYVAHVGGLTTKQAQGVVSAILFA